MSTGRAALVAGTFSAGIELSSDLVCYAAGIAIGVACEVALRMRRAA